MYSNPGDQFHWNEIYFHQIFYWNVMPSCNVVVFYINQSLFLNGKNIRNDILLIEENIYKKKLTKIYSVGKKINKK